MAAAAGNDAMRARIFMLGSLTWVERNGRENSTPRGQGGQHAGGAASLCVERNSFR